ncbi:MAG: DUF3575 domain-containing protein [Tannerellaceae bacterium]|nr:DUF3575 domain-containing protein [Tannerellaceae bacterium]
MKSLKPQLILVLLGWLLIMPSLKAQEKLYPPRLALKTNLLYWATTTPNLSIEYAFSDHLSLDVAGSYNPWLLSSKEKNKKLKHWTVQPELRLWTCEKYNGGFFGVHAHYGRFNAGGIKLPFRIWKGLADYRYEGYLTGAGISYGYQWYLSPRWNLEAVISLGYAYIHYKEYECRHCGEYRGKDHSHYFGPTKMGVSIVYLF